MVELHVLYIYSAYGSYAKDSSSMHHSDFSHIDPLILLSAPGALISGEPSTMLFVFFSDKEAFSELILIVVLQSSIHHVLVTSSTTSIQLTGAR